ncbi:MAG: diacylglycerol/polyprenol kinase family protein [Rivularia sp. (in: cyanobacteria)]
MTPFLQNLIVTALTFIYVFGLVAVMNFCVTRLKLSPDISRKITHIGAGSLIGFLALYNDSHWSKYLNVTIFVVWIVLLIQKGLFADDNDEAVKTMTRNGDKSELLKGPLYFVIVATICGTLFYKTFAGVIAIAILGWGDGIAPIIGSRYGKLKYEVLSTKSVEGTVSMLVAAFAASVFFVWLIIPNELNIMRIFLLTIIATIVEACSPKEIDNILIPTVVILAALTFI